MYVLDATPLIYLAKSHRLGLLDDLSDPCLVPEPVYEEVVTVGVAEGHADARRVERAVDEGRLDVVPVESTETFERLRRNENLSDADVAVLAVADARDATAVMDEAYGRDVAAAEAIDTRGTAYLVLSLLRDDVIDPREARATIDAMVEAGWYCSTDLYAKLLRAIDDHS